jgi:hypothetical protein
MNKIECILTDSIRELIQHSSSEDKIRGLEDKHNVKLHFIPYKYRVFGGILQSMNIQFGNFIEKVMAEVISDNPNNELVEEYSGKKSNSFSLSKKSDALIDAYITNCQTNNLSEQELQTAYENLIDEIKENESNTENETAIFKHDVDVLFRDKTKDIYYYVEIKYNDDHDTGKFVDINRKLLKTYAYLQRELGERVTVAPILFYFNNKKMKGNIYLPEDKVIYRGKRFFEAFANVKYEEMDNYMKTISESPETIQAFDELYQRVVKS